MRWLRIERGAWSSGWFPWATVGIADLPRLAAQAGLWVDWVHEHAGRCFARLEAVWQPTEDLAA